MPGKHARRRPVPRGRRPASGRDRWAWLDRRPFCSPLSAVRAAWETSDAMSTSPALVCLGEPLIEFNRPREGDGRTWLQGFGGDFAECRDRGRPPGCLGRLPHQPRPGLDGRRLPRAVAGPKASMPRRVSRHPSAPTGVSFVTHSDAGHKFDYLRKNSAASLMTAGRLAGRLHRRRPVPSSLGHRPGDQRQRPPDLRSRHRGRSRRRRESVLRHQPAPAPVGPRYRTPHDRCHHRPLRRRPAEPRRFAATHRPHRARRHRRPSTSSSARRWSR